MQDEMIVDLYWKRDESAISETERKYGRYLSKIAYNILSDWEDSKETVNDTYLLLQIGMSTILCSSAILSGGALRRGL